jgi:hypothetical protein
LADCRKPGHVDCEFYQEGSCVAGPEDGWERVSGQWARCRHRVERIG